MFPKSPFHSYLWAFATALSVLLPATACHQKSPAGRTASDTATSTTPTVDSTRKDFYPVGDYIRSEISTVDSTPIAILKYSIQNNRTDSAFISSPVFHRLAQEFLLPDLDTAVFEKNYSQVAFTDENSGLLTFTYSPRNKELPLRRVDVILDPEANNQVKSIYMENASSSGDTLVLKKLLWRAKKSFLIITTLQPTGKAAIVRQEKVVWDPS
jgi:hypothetical protein